MLALDRRVQFILIWLVVVASGCDNDIAVPNGSLQLPSPEILASITPPAPVEVTPAEYSELASSASIDGTTLAWAGAASVVTSYVEGSMTVFAGSVPVPAVVSQTIYAKVQVDNQIPTIRHKNFAWVIPFPWFGRTDDIQMPELDCEEVEHRGNIYGHTNHVATWSVVLNDVPFVIPAQDESDDQDSCNVGGGGSGGGGGGGLTCVLEPICIDIWNEQEGRWEEYWCGYASVCT